MKPVPPEKGEGEEAEADAQAAAAQAAEAGAVFSAEGAGKDHRILA